MKTNSASLLTTLALAMLAAAGSLAAVAQADPVAPANLLPRGLFCSAEGRGIWGGRDVALRYQTSLLQPGAASAGDTVTLYADESPAALVPLRADGSSSALAAYDGSAEGNPDVRVEVLVATDLSATFLLSTWQNARVPAQGRCQWNYGG